MIKKCTLIFWCLCIPFISIADESQVGVATFSVLELPFGARGAAMGAFCGLANDVTAIWWNPGGLGQMDKGQAHFCHQEWFQGFRDEYGSVVFPTRFGVIGGSLLYSSVTGVEANTGESKNFQKIGEFSPYETVLSLAYAREIIEKLYIGMTLGFLYQNLEPEVSGVTGDKGKAIATNIGMLWKKGDFGVGASLQNIGTTVWYVWGGSEYLPRTLKLGASWSGFKNLVGVFDLNVPQFGEFNYHLGGEYYIAKDFLSLRAGYNRGPQSLDKFDVLDALSMGFGVKLKNLDLRDRFLGDIELDYAYSSYGDLGMTHRINLNWTFGAVGQPKSGNIIVRVIDAKTNEPLQAIVTTVGTLTDTAITSPDVGAVVFQKVPIGKIYITTQKDFYTSSTDSIFLLLNETSEVNVSLEYTGPEGVSVENLVKEGICGRILVGQLTEEGTVEPLRDGVITYEGADSGVAVADSEGWYKIPDISVGNYTLTIESAKHDYFPEIIKNITVEHEKATLLHCTLKKLKTLRLYFERDRAYVHPSMFEILDEIVEFLKRYQENAFEIHGHTDPRLPKKFKNNIELSEARANAVLEYLVQKDISKDRLSVKGWGAEKPVAENDTEQGMALNRRIELIIKPLD